MLLELQGGFAVKRKINIGRGLVLWSGPSALNGYPIVVVATFASSNRKTGDMIQVWVLTADKAPIDAYKDGTDDAVCGDCKHRQSLGGGCYVTIANAPQAV